MPLDQQDGIRLLRYIAATDQLEACSITHRPKQKSKLKLIRKLSDNVSAMFRPGSVRQIQRQREYNERCEKGDGEDIDENDSADGNNHEAGKADKYEVDTNGEDELDDECFENDENSASSHIPVKSILRDLGESDCAKLYKSVKALLMKLHTTDYATARAFLGTPRFYYVRDELKKKLHKFLEKDMELVVIDPSSTDEVAAV